MTNEDLLAIAKDASLYAYAPYSGFCVGAALLGINGQVYTGCNVENASFGATNCAERAAVFKAVSDGCREFEKIAIVNVDGKLAYPCGICRQVLSEFGSDIEVIVKEQGKIQTYTLGQLLPHGFSLEEKMEHEIRNESI